MNKNQSVPAPLRKLVDYLSNLEARATVEKLEQLLSDLNVSAEDLRPFACFGDTSYRRNLVCETEHFELLCICWKSGQRSPIHDHAQSTCGLRIIQGVATETLFERTDCGQLKAVSSSECSQGSVCSSQDSDVHQVSNLHASDDLMTLHIYSPPLKTMATYSLLGPGTETYTPVNFMICQYADGI